MSVEFNESPAIRSLSDDLRAKALEYASALGARGPRPTTVLGTAVTLAREWKSGRLSADVDGDRGVALLVQPRGGRWVIRRANAPEPTHVFSVREDAVRRAQELALGLSAPVFVFGPGGTLLERYAATNAATALAVAAAPRPAPRPTMPLPRAVTCPRPVLAPSPGPEVEHVSKSVATELKSEVQALAVAVVAVAKRGRRWEVTAPDTALQSFTTRRKAAKVAGDLARSLGLEVAGL